MVPLESSSFFTKDPAISTRNPSHPRESQNAITSFRSSWPLIPCYANTIGPAIIFSSDYAIGGADGVLSRGMQWQGMSFWMTLRHGPVKEITSSWIPTMPGKLFFMQELAGPLCADTN